MNTTITINDHAYKLLKRLKRPGASFSDVILEHFCRQRLPAQSCGELLDRLESMPPPDLDEARLETFAAGRGRRSRRKS